VFETSKSRKYNALTWIAIPVGFNSTGLQAMFDDFEPRKAAALYGAWCLMLKLAATAPVRGTLAGRNGEPYTPRRLARMTGLNDPELFDELLEWCIHGADSGRFNWLEYGDIKTIESAAVAALPAPVPAESPAGPSSGPDTDDTDTRPAPKSAPLVSFPSLVANTASLQPLQTVPLEPGTAAGYPGSVTAVLNAGDITGQPPDFWLTWYLRQAASSSPMLPGQNVAEFVLLLALLFAVRRMSDKSVRTTKLALFIDAVSKQDAGMIGPADIRQARTAADNLLKRKPQEQKTLAAGKTQEQKPPTEKQTSGPTFAERRARRKRKLAAG